MDEDSTYVYELVNFNYQLNKRFTNTELVKRKVLNTERFHILNYIHQTNYNVINKRFEKYSPNSVYNTYKLFNYRINNKYTPNEVQYL